MDRRALLIGCWENLRPPSRQKTKGIVDRLSNSLQGSILTCRSLCGELEKPTKFLNPSQSDIFKAIENIKSRPSDETELLFYYIGHSVPAADNSLSISLGGRSQILNSQVNDTDVEMRPVRLSKIMDELAENGFRKVIAVFDTCHSGRAVHVMGGTFQSYVAMSSTGNAYSYNAEFSDAFIATLERPLQQKDQRVDKSVRAITFERIFQFALTKMPPERLLDKESHPVIQGPMAKSVVLEVPLEVPKSYNQLAYSRSIYRRTHEILKIIQSSQLSTLDLVALISSNPLFQINKSTGKPISGDRISEYLNFLIKTGLIEEERGRWRLTAYGKDAAGLFFNQVILDVIENRLFPNELNFDLLEKAIQELIDDRLNATPSALAERLIMKGSSLPLTDENRFALRLLPSTKRFGKGSSEALHVVTV